MAAHLASLFSMVGWRPLPPAMLATAFSGQCLKVLFNLLAIMPFWRPSSFGAASSRPLVPSGVVPGDEDGGCSELWIDHTGEGAGPNCFHKFLFRVLGAKFRDMVVIFRFLESLSVKCTGVD